MNYSETTEAIIGETAAGFRPTDKVFVSGCFELLHGGHVQFFNDARALGKTLTVCFASDYTIRIYKKREPGMSQEHRRMLLASLRMVDAVVMGDITKAQPLFMDFEERFTEGNYDVLAVTEDDVNIKHKRAFVERLGKMLVVLPKTCSLPPVSTTAIRETILTTSGLSTRPAAPFTTADFFAGGVDLLDYLVLIAGKEGAELWHALFASTRKNLVSEAKEKGFDLK